MLQPFNDSDWELFMGAEEFSPSDPPLIYCGDNVVIVADNTGLTIVLDQECFTLPLYSKDQCIIMANTIRMQLSLGLSFDSIKSILKGDDHE